MTVRRAISSRIVFTTSFGIEDQAITHTIFAQELDIDVITLDTGLLVPETLEVWNATQRHYGWQIRGGLHADQSLERAQTCCVGLSCLPLSSARGRNDICCGRYV